MKILQTITQEVPVRIDIVVENFYNTWDDGDDYEDGLQVLNEYIDFHFEEIDYTPEERKEVEQIIFEDINNCVTEYWGNLHEIELWLDEKLREDSKYDNRLKPFNGKDLLNIIKSKLDGHEDQKALLNELMRHDNY